MKMQKKRISRSLRQRKNEQTCSSNSLDVLLLTSFFKETWILCKHGSLLTYGGEDSV